MSTVAQIVNLVNCGSSDMGAGLAACPFDLGTVVTLGVLPKGFSVPADTEFTYDYLQELEQLGKLRILQGVIDFADGTPDNERVTRAGTGRMRASLKHPYMWTFTFDNGIDFFKALNLLDGNERNDLWIWDDAGNMLGSKKRDGGFGGLDMGMFDTNKYILGNEHSESITIQIDRQSFDRNAEWITAENLDFVGKDLDDYNEVNITVSPLAVGATALKFKAMLLDNSHLLEGATVSNFRVLKTTAGATTTVTPSAISYDTNPGYITLTIAAAVASSTYSVETWDAALSTPGNIINLENVLYKGEAATVLTT